MAGFLTTHVLDTALGKPACGLRIELFCTNEGRELIGQAITNQDGRTDAPILDRDAFSTGTYELMFYAGDYLADVHDVQKDRQFLSDIPIRFSMTEQDHYHVPLLLSPFGFSTYRGS